MARILVADDDKTTRLMLQRILEAEGHEVVVALDGLEAWDLVHRQLPDVVLCDWMMPGVDGVEICRRIKADSQLRAVYVVLVTAKEKGEEKVEALEAGADEFLSKPVDRAELIARVKVGLRLVEYQKSLRDMALTDDLTGVANRRAFQAALDREFARARRYGSPLSLLLIDVDRFKEINDHFGHAQGDRVLRIVADRVRASMRSSDAVFRIGGDEFAVLMPEPENEARSAAVRLLGLFRDRADGTLPDPDHPSISVGIASLQADERPEDLCRHADTEMYAHKSRLSKGGRS